ncbi:MAG: AMP-binding protein, partial [Desulfosudaceae bacterium]
MSDISKTYDAHLEDFQKTAHVKGGDEYRQLYEESINHPDAFWSRQAERYLDWDKKWETVLNYDFNEATIEWFAGGKLNASFNCLDRHLDTIGDKIAYYWEGDDPTETKSYTYGDLYRQVNAFAAALRAKGVQKGDRVIIYLPMIIELPVAMLACARIGAIHSVVFGGFSAEAIANRIIDCGARVVITADGGYRSGKPVPLKKNVDAAREKCPEVNAVIVVNRVNSGIELDPGRESWWHEIVSDPDLPDYVPPEEMDAEDPLFILYTSGSTGKPKGVVHTHGGYLVYAAMTTEYVFDLRPDEVFWCTADIGWITGHSYIVYGPLTCGLTGVMFEGVPNYPDFDRFWAIVEKYGVNKFYTAPTAIR